jgi:hypothetical protein
MTDHPIQPFVDDNGIKRFLENKLVSVLVESYGHNNLAVLVARSKESRADYDQILQLIGYSVSGAPLSDMTRARVEIAEKCHGEVEENGFSTGYANGKADALQSVRDAIEELGDA